MENLPEDFSQEAFLALGFVGLLAIGVAIIATFIIVVGSLKLSIKWAAGKNVSFIACFGWLIAIGFVNSFVMVSFTLFFGQAAGLIAMPLTWFTTVYMISVAANCGLMQAFGVWILNSILGTVGIVVVILVTMVPLGMIGATVQAASDTDQNGDVGGVENQFLVDESSDAIEVPEATPVVLNTDTAEPKEAQPKERSQVRREVEPSPKRGTRAPKPARVSKPTRVPKAAPKKANDGTTLNPFFQ